MAAAVNFEAWKSTLRDNCAKEDKLPAFNSLDDFVLSLFFNRGIEPTPEAMIEDGSDQRKSCPPWGQQKIA